MKKGFIGHIFLQLFGIIIMQNKCFWHQQYGWFCQIFVISRSTEIPIESNFLLWVYAVCVKHP